MWGSLLWLLLMDVAVATPLVVSCTGKSTGLPVAQCAAWAALFDATGGAKWKSVGVPECRHTRTDPCGCHSKLYTFGVTCNSAATTVVSMYASCCVPPPAPPAGSSP
jgi:hypothetical protein